MSIHPGRPPDRPGGPGRGHDLPSNLSQGEKALTSPRDLPSKHSQGTKCPAADFVPTEPNAPTLGVMSRPAYWSARIGCPAQPVGFICLPHREEAAAPTCPLGHTVERLHIR